MLQSLDNNVQQYFIKHRSITTVFFLAIVVESKKAFKVMRHFSDQQSISRMHTTHQILSYRVVPLQTYCLHISEEAVQNGVNYYLLSWLFQSVPQTAALERIAKQREMRKAN